jgi:hypothetical protein
LSVVLRRRGGFGDDGVLDGADALDLDAHQLTWFQQSSGEEADAAGRPGGDEVAGTPPGVPVAMRSPGSSGA